MVVQSEHFLQAISYLISPQNFSYVAFQYCFITYHLIYSFRITKHFQTAPLIRLSALKVQEWENDGSFLWVRNIQVLGKKHLIFCFFDPYRGYMSMGEIGLISFPTIRIWALRNYLTSFRLHFFIFFYCTGTHSICCYIDCKLFCPWKSCPGGWWTIINKHWGKVGVCSRRSESVKVIQFFTDCSIFYWQTIWLESIHSLYTSPEWTFFSHYIIIYSNGKMWGNLWITKLTDCTDNYRNIFLQNWGKPPGLQ